MLGQIEDLAVRQRSGVRALGAAPWGYFQCSDRLISLLALFPNHWDTLAAWIHEVTGNESALAPKYRGSPMGRYSHVDEIERLINSLTCRFPADDFCAEAQSRGVPAMPVNSVADLLNDPQLEATGFWQTLEQPGTGRFRWPGPPFTVRGMAPVQRAPRLGEHSRELLSGRQATV
jgi:crotonobetainyl-CoA:carnitine CoA-transferase CaiB-like acyl-CoA transferase